MWHLTLLLVAISSLTSAKYLQVLNEAGETLNTTADSGERGVGGYNYGAHVERVNFQQCSQMNLYTPHFYQGLVVNTWGTKSSTRTNRLCFGIYVKGTGVISGSWGPVLSSYNVAYHTWEMLHMYASDTDIRTKEPAKLRFHLADGLPQIYIPLYMADAATGDAYMLHLYPERSFLSNPNTYDFTGGILWARASAHVLYVLELDVAGLIRDLVNFKAPNYNNFVQDHGVLVTDTYNLREPWSYTDIRQISLRPTSKGAANEFICSTTPGQSAYTWAQFRKILDAQFKWL